MRRMRRIAFLFTMGGKVWFYRAGSIPACVGDWLKYDYGHDSGGGTSIMKETSDFVVNMNKSTGWGYTQNTIDLTDIDTLFIQGFKTAAEATSITVTVALTYTALAFVAGVGLGTSNAWVSLDTSGISGAHYVRVGRQYSSHVTSLAYVYNLYGKGHL